MLEGFGMPPIEALQHSALVACSTSMSIPEVCGASVTYFDPTDEISIELAILRLFDTGFINLLNDYSDFEMKLLSEKRDSDLSKIIDLIIKRIYDVISIGVRFNNIKKNISYTL